MRTRIITTNEIKTLLKMTGSSNDAILEIWNDTIMDVLCEILAVDDLARHTVTDERVEVSGCYNLVVNDFPVDTNEDITIKDTFYNTEITGYTFRLDPKNLRTLKLYSDAGIPQVLYRDEVFISYTAGYRVQDTLEVLSIAALAAKTITVTIAGVSTTYTLVASGATGTQINIGVDQAATAANIATMLNSTVSGAVVTLPLGSRVTLGTATTSQFTITNSDIPPSLKMAVALMVGGGLAEKSKSDGIQSYTIGSKTVTFKSGNDYNMVNSILSRWLPFHKKIIIRGV